MGRLSTYTPEVADAICERLATGEPLRAICRDEAMPAWRTVYDWIEANSDFAARFAQAREVGFDAIAEEALEIADTPREGVRRKETEDGVEEVHEDMLGHRRLQVDTRLKLLAKWCPKKYGDRIDVGNADGKPFEVADTGEAAAKIAALLATAASRKGLADLL
jgi:hypothetical protein